MRRLAVCLMLAAAVAACHRPSSRLTKPATSNASAVVPGVTPDDQEPLFADKPFRYCVPATSAPPVGSVTALIDASGSMAAVRKALPKVAGWLDLAVSRTRDAALSVETASLCEFNETIGIGRCHSRMALQPDYRASGDTNLHQAIAAASRSDLTFIVTDGVAAASASNRGNCASAVDAACVARALRDAVHPSDERRGQSHGGIWIVPLVVPHDGVFYTEKQIAPDSFDGDATSQQVHTDVDANIEVAVQDPKVDRSQRLNFVYRGPRILLLIVIARSADVGRAAVAALAEVAGQADVAHVDSIRAYSGGVAGLTPIEVYPGIATPVEWGRSKDDPNESPVGTIDTRFESGTLYVDCPRNRESEVTHIVPAVARDGSQQSRCVDLWSFPAFNFRLHPPKPDSDVVLASFIKSYTTKEPLSKTSELWLRVRCGEGQAPRACSNPLTAQYTASANYAATARAFMPDDRGAGGPSVLVKTISTLQPQREPHRVYALADTLRIFYDEIGSEQYRVPLGSIRICNDEGKRK